MLCMRYKSVNFRAGMSPDAPNWLGQIDPKTANEELKEGLKLLGKVLFFS